MTQTPYDLERAARVGGFTFDEDDQETGEEVAVRLHSVLERRTKAGVTFDAPAVVSETLAACEDMWDWSELREDQRGGQQAALANAIGAMLIDLIKQTREARGVPETPEADHGE